MKKMKADNKTILKGERGYRKLVPNTKAEERKMDWELTSVLHGSHDDSHDSLFVKTRTKQCATCAKLLFFCRSPCLRRLVLHDDISCLSKL